MEKLWLKIRNKYRMQHSQGNKTEIDGKMVFLNPYLKSSKQNKSVAQSSSKAHDDDLFEAFKDNDAPEDVSPDEDQIPNQARRETLTEIASSPNRQQLDYSLDILPRAEIVTKSPKISDDKFNEYRGAIKKAFNDEIKMNKVESAAYLMNQIENF